MSIELKVKIKSLAEEARIIRAEERKLPGPQRSSLRDHRVTVVRRASRHTLLAYAFLRGKRYRATERTSRTSPDWSTVEKMIKKYGPPAHNTSFEDWRKEDEQEESMCSSAA